MIGLPYELKNEFQVRFKEGTSTIMACPEGNVERGFIETLTRVNNLTTDGNHLYLNRAIMAPLAQFELVE